MPDDDIRPVSEHEIAHFFDDARRSGLALAQTTEYFGYWRDGVLCGFCGLLQRGTRLFHKSAFVHPAYRRKGIYLHMLAFTMDEARRRGHDRVYATCTPMSLKGCLRMGARITRRKGKLTDIVFDLSPLDTTTKDA